MKLRLNNHILQTEKGQYHKLTKIPIHERLCYTSGLKKYEAHFAMVCPFKGDDMCFKKMATMKILFWLYNINNYILCWLMA